MLRSLQGQGDERQADSVGTGMALTQVIQALGILTRRDAALGALRHQSVERVALPPALGVRPAQPREVRPRAVEVRVRRSRVRFDIVTRQSRYHRFMARGTKPPIVSEFRAWLRNNGKAASTADDYTRVARRLIESELDVATVALNELGPWFHQLSGKDSTRAMRRHALRSFFDFLMWRGDRDDNPANDLNVSLHGRRRAEPIPDDAIVDTLEQLRIRDKRAFYAALFIMHTRMRIADVVALHERGPIPEQLTIGEGAKLRTVRLNSSARSLLRQLGGSVGVQERQLQNRFRAAGTHSEALRVTPVTDAVWRFTPEPPSPLDVPQYTGTAIEAYRDECWMCLRYGNLRGATVLARATIQLCTRRYLPAPRGRWFGALALDLAQLAPRLGDGWSKLAGDLKDYGNEWAHPDPRDAQPPPSEATVKRRLSTMDNVLRYMAEVERRGDIMALNP